MRTKQEITRLWEMVTSDDSELQDLAISIVVPDYEEDVSDLPPIFTKSLARIKGIVKTLNILGDEMKDAGFSIEEMRKLVDEGIKNDKRNSKE